MSIRIEYATGECANITPAQYASIKRLAERFTIREPVVVSPMIGGDGCVILQAGRLWVGVEKDGYAHT